MKKINEKLIVLLILGLVGHQHQVDAIFGALQKGLQLASFAWDTFGMANTAHDTYSKFTTPSVGDVLDETEKIIDTVDKQGAHLEQKLQQSVEMLLSRLPLMAEIAGDVRLLNTYIVRIDELYGDLKILMEEPEFFDERDLRYLIKTWISRDADDAQGATARMYALIVPQRLGKVKKSLFVLLAQESRGSSLDVCDTGASPQQRLVDLFNIAMEAEMKSFATLSVGLLLKGHLEKVNHTVDLERALEKIEKRAADYQDILRGTISVAAKIFRRCDPAAGHKKGVTFYELDRFLQSVVVSEGIFEGDNECSEGCEGYDQPASKYPECDGVGCSDEDPRSCGGRLTNCESMKRTAHICNSLRTETRRYEWFTDGKGNSFGDQSVGCREKVQNTWGRGNCDICRCICVEDIYTKPHLKHYISLRKRVTNVAENMIVTGLAFVIVNRVVHVRVMQAKLGPRAEVFKDSVSWLEPEKTLYHPEREAFFVSGANGRYGGTLMIEGTDIAELSWEERRINLDSLKGPSNHVLTGVRFRRWTNLEKGNIQMEIHVTSFDAETGKLDPKSSVWLSAEDMPYGQEYLNKQRTPHASQGSRNPKEAMHTTIDSEPYTYIDIDTSSLEHDAGQTTIPLLDALPVVSNPPGPLVGVSLSHKAKPGYGGFLTFVLEGVDLKDYL